MRKHLVTRLSARPVLLQPGRVSLPQALGPGRIRRAGIGPAEGPRHPIDPSVRRMERFAAAVRRRQVHGAQSGRVSPLRRHGPPSRHEDAGLHLHRLLAVDRSRFPPGMVAAKATGCSCGYWDMARCSPASPGWRAYLLPRLVRILDEYGVDGIYIDCGIRHQRREGQARSPLGAGQRRSGRLRGDAPIRRSVDRSAGPDLRRGQAPRRHPEAPRRRRPTSRRAAA